MRLPLIAPADLSAEQRPVYADMRAGIEKYFQGFKTIADNGALMGPWNPWLHEPKIGKPIWDLTLALSVSPSLPRTVREVAILLTSAKSMGAGRWHVFRWVIFPHMIPSFFTGMRLAMTGVLLGVLLAELYVSTAGIGYFTTLFTQNFDPTKLLGLISMLAAMAIGLNELVRRAEVRFSRWRSG